MKKMTGVLSIILLFAFSGIFAQVDLFDSLSPDARKVLADSWLDTGKTFQNLKKLKDAKACFEYANDAYPMGASATEARQVLQDSFRIRLSFETNKQFDFYVKRAKVQTNEQFRLNNYLMAAELKADKDVFYQAAVSAYGQNEKDLAKTLLQKAFAAGLDKASISEELKSLGL